MAVPKEPLVGVEELARRLGVSHWWVRRAVREDRIPYKHVGRHLRFNWDAVYAALDTDPAATPASRRGDGKRRKAG